MRQDIHRTCAGSVLYVGVIVIVRTYLCVPQTSGCERCFKILCSDSGSICNIIALRSVCVYLEIMARRNSLNETIIIFISVVIIVVLTLKYFPSALLEECRAAKRPYSYLWENLIRQIMVAIYNI